VTDGFLLVDKASGRTSHDVVAAIRRASRIKKVGHAGTLDPMATGLLVLGLGKGTRLLRFVQDHAKEYEARVQFGVATDSLDADGAVLEREPMPVTEADVVAAAARFRGMIMQVPPMVSARRIGGRRLYELAREGREVEREARPVEIHELVVEEFAPSEYPEATLRVRCGKGTYIRTLADDIARALGGRAHLTALRRTANGSLRVDAAHTVDEAVEAAERQAFPDLVLSLRDGLIDMAESVVTAEIGEGVSHGTPVAAAHLGREEDGPVKVVGPGGGLLAVYRVEGRHAVAEVVTA
jgi:tRNA pseudouridine55 synthase